jgi:hypothetical protein
MAEGSRSRWADPAGWAALAALAAGLAVASREIGSLGGDDAEYVLLANSLARFDGYASGWYPGPPVPHTQYPPLFPLLLAPLVAGTPGSFLACHVLVSLLGAAAVFCLARLFERRGLPPWAASLGALAPVLSRLWLASAADVLSDIPFLAFAAAALLLLEPGTEERLPPVRIALAAVAAGLAFYTRTAGLALVLPVAAALSLDRRTRGRAGWIAAGSLLAGCGLWFLRGALLGTGGGYGDQLAAGAEATGGVLGRAWSGFSAIYFPRTPAFLFPRSTVLLGVPVWTVAGWVLWGTAALSLFHGLRRRRTLAVTEVFFLVYLLMQSAWPFEDPRFALPLAFLLVPFLLEEVHRDAARLRAPAMAAAVAGALLLVPNGEFLVTRVLPRASRERPAAAPGDHEPARFPESWKWTDGQYAQAGLSLASYLHACDLVRADAVPGAGRLPEGTLLAFNPRIASLLCGRPAVPVASPVDTREVVLLLVDNFGGPPSESLRRYRDEHGRDLESLLRLPGGVELLRVKR